MTQNQNNSSKPQSSKEWSKAFAEAFANSGIKVVPLKVKPGPKQTFIVKSFSSSMIFRKQPPRKQNS